MSRSEARPVSAMVPRVSVATAGSFNNEWGLPLTVLRATSETRQAWNAFFADLVARLPEVQEAHALTAPDRRHPLGDGREVG